MKNLLLFFIKYNGFFLFILLEALSFYLIFTGKTNKNHQSFFKAAFGFKAGVVEKYYNVIHFMSLPSENAELHHENSLLKDSLQFLRYNSPVRRDSMRDSTKKVLFHYIDAEIVDNSTSRTNNFMTLNRGSNHGVKPDMGVINATGKGILGIVKHVTPNYSAVMSVLHLDSRISAKIRRNNYFGTLEWNGKSPRSLYLTAIPKHAKVIKGDSVVTSGYSGIFPKDIMVGLVDSVTVEPGSDFYTIRVQLSCDMRNVSYAYIIENKVQQELDKLKKLTENE